MKNPNGENPMEWDCSVKGCFNIKKRPKIEVFAKCFPGKIAMSDIDAIVEIGGNFMLLEWKSDGVGLKHGQRIMFERMTKHENFFVLLVEGCAETMNVIGYKLISNGEIPEQMTPCTLHELLKLLYEFSKWAVKNPFIRNPSKGFGT
jgi:hypothetical protein